MTKTPAEHAAAAEELAAAAAKVYAVAGQLTEVNGGIDPELHAGLFREMSAVAQLAQVHATLATITPALNWSRAAKSEVSA